jgi:hypothetical protein
MTFVQRAPKHGPATFPTGPPSYQVIIHPRHPHVLTTEFLPMRPMNVIIFRAGIWTRLGQTRLRGSASGLLEEERWPGVHVSETQRSMNWKVKLIEHALVTRVALDENS